MKKYLDNLIIIIVFILCVFLADYLLIIIGKINPASYQNNNLELNTLRNENQVLKKQLKEVLSLNNYAGYQDYDLLKSNLLLRDVYNFHETITIRYGQDQNIQKGMAVVSEKGLIGIITKVNKKTSVVSLLTSKDSNISIAIGENYGALDDYDPDKKLLIAHNFNNYEQILKNEEVYTSGLGLIPEGLYIGKVSNTSSSNIEQIVKIQSDVDFNNLKYVGIIKGMKQV